MKIIEVWKTEPCPEAIQEADEELEALVWILAILLAVVPTLLKLLRLI